MTSPACFDWNGGRLCEPRQRPEFHTLEFIPTRPGWRSCCEPQTRVPKVYLWLPSAEVAVRRVRERVRKGGHDVPAADVRRRFERSLSNLVRVYLPLVDEWRILDNSGSLPRLVADGTPAGTRVLDETIFSVINSGRR